ncbi:hypothetical protein Pmar_PMAR009634 [Perkinsus marinus ATCC 50983]|uniref:Uncharacterized protein n=1 Tax=Perkinsus marinus (strain ATCC 50983 / TXsc) TaxID=423536 RepID=C5M017_PERM5|nr:hypothetical protein Pmar_PMAR009634 [Perkinsus marinus ATCC 50983]EEQ97675.1 hypothetical protein Pmar_PMAR009634 [Perkinsus marinus ATCC 50983]|eukprot:XP_002764958.1 hypothetical protein Pmar_PMAR009634 [Perkinsus marinus ATCC 50983]
MLLSPCPDAIGHYDLAHPLETLKHVIAHCTPTFDWHNVALIINRGHLSDLMRFVWGMNSRELEFTISCGGEGQPAVVERSWKYHCRELTYGWAFQEAATRPQPGAEQLIRHHRVSFIRLGGLHLVVRAEVDACTGQADKQGIRQLSDGDWELCEDGTSRLWCFKSGAFDPMETAAKATYEQMLLGDCKLSVLGKHSDRNIISELIGVLLEIVKNNGHAVVVWNGKSRKLIILALFFSK